MADEFELLLECLLYGRLHFRNASKDYRPRPPRLPRRCDEHIRRHNRDSLSHRDFFLRRIQRRVSFTWFPLDENLQTNADMGKPQKSHVSGAVFGASVREPGPPHGLIHLHKRAYWQVILFGHAARRGGRTCAIQLR